MRIGAVLSPLGDWPLIAEAARLADRSGLDSIGFWDHYHSEQPDWAYVCGWTAYGALAATTDRVRIVPMVICNINHTLGVLAKETALLAITSAGRFELGIGAGDYPAEYKAWHQPFPSAVDRVARLEETIAALRQLWQGGLVTFEGKHIQLTDAACTPSPPVPPRVVVGVAGSKRMLASAIGYADELNLYASEPVLQDARQAVESAGRAIDISMYIHFDPGAWPADVTSALAVWRDLGLERAMVNVGFGPDPSSRVAQLAEAQAKLA